MIKGILLDSNILIDYLRDKTEAVNYLEGLKKTPYISSITVAELYAGIRNSKEKNILDQFIDAFQILTVDVLIAKLGGEYRQKYGKSHSVDLIDALIAATASAHHLPLASLNKKHFPMIKKLISPY